MNLQQWSGCYDAGWRDLIVPAAFAHPAKMARGLVARIFDELFAMGALERGSVVVDPFGGIGTTAIEGASRGVQVFCCELESKFVDLARQNFALHARDWETMGRPAPAIVQGDSRKLRQALGPVLASAVVSSPPYAEIASGSGGLNTKPPKHAGQQGGRSAASASQDTDSRYGESEGQLARMSLGDVDAIVGSPPFVENRASAHQSSESAPSNQRLAATAKGGMAFIGKDYGHSDGQLGAMPAGDVDAIVSSPPFTQGYSGGGGINRVGYRKDGVLDDKVGERTYQGTAADRVPGNLETLTLGEVDAVVSSPPYEGSLADGGDVGIKWEKARRETTGGGEHQAPGGSVHARYPGDTDGQIGNATGETFWTAALEIVRESYAILKPGGVAVWVVKAFVRDKKLVDFPGDWRKLCEHVGFETFLEVHASLVAEEVKSHLFDGEVTKRRERKSFFRRLAEKKGSPRIDWETVYFMRKPEVS